MREKLAQLIDIEADTLRSSKFPLDERIQLGWVRVINGKKMAIKIEIWEVI